MMCIQPRNNSAIAMVFTVLAGMSLLLGDHLLPYHHQIKGKRIGMDKHFQPKDDTNSNQELIHDQLNFLAALILSDQPENDRNRNPTLINEQLELLTEIRMRLGDQPEHDHNSNREMIHERLQLLSGIRMSLGDQPENDPNSNQALIQEQLELLTGMIQKMQHNDTAQKMEQKDTNQGIEHDRYDSEYYDSEESEEKKQKSEDGIQKMGQEKQNIAYGIQNMVHNDTTQKMEQKDINQEIEHRNQKIEHQKIVIESEESEYSDQKLAHWHSKQGSHSEHDQPEHDHNSNQELIQGKFEEEKKLTEPILSDTKVMDQICKEDKV
jgi:hypothetical protein